MFKFQGFTGLNRRKDCSLECDIQSQASGVRDRLQTPGLVSGAWHGSGLGLGVGVVVRVGNMTCR